MIVINNAQQLIDILNTRTNILQFISICLKTAFLREMHLCINKDIHADLFMITDDKILLDNILDYINITEQDISIIEISMNEFIRTKKIPINDKVKLKLNKAALCDLFNKYLLTSPYWKLIKKELKTIKNSNIITTLKDITDCNLQVGDYVQITRSFILNELHSLYVTPLIYINGNIIWVKQNQLYMRQKRNVNIMIKF